MLEAGECPPGCFIADFAGDMDRGGGTCRVASTIGLGEKCALRVGDKDTFLPRTPPSIDCRGISRLGER